MTKRQTCTDHCSGCGRHFHGLAAFDADFRDHTCQDPASIEVHGNPVMQVWTDDGYCDLSRPKRDHVIVWQKWQNEQQREWLSGQNSKPGRAVA